MASNPNSVQGGRFGPPQPLPHRKNLPAKFSSAEPEDVVFISEEAEENLLNNQVQGAGSGFLSAVTTWVLSWHNLQQVIADAFKIETKDASKSREEKKCKEQKRLEEKLAKVKQQSKEIGKIVEKIRALLAGISSSSPQEANKKIAQINELANQVAALFSEASGNLKNVETEFKDSLVSSDSALALSIDNLKIDISIASRAIKNLGQKADLYARLWGQHSNRLS